MKGSTRVLYPKHASGGVLGLSRLWFNIQAYREPQIGFTETGSLVRTSGLRTQEVIGESVFEYKMGDRSSTFSYSKPAARDPLVPVNSVVDIKSGKRARGAFEQQGQGQIQLPADHRLDKAVSNIKVRDKLAQTLKSAVESDTQRDSGELWNLEVYKVSDPRDIKNHVRRPADWESLQEQYGHYVVVEKRFTVPGGLYINVSSFDAEGKQTHMFGRGRPLKDRDYGAKCLERPFRPIS